MSYLPYKGKMPTLSDEQYELIGSIKLPLMDRHDWVAARNLEAMRRIGCSEDEVHGYIIAYHDMRRQKRHQEKSNG